MASCWRGTRRMRKGDEGELRRSWGVLSSGAGLGELTAVARTGELELINGWKDAIGGRGAVRWEAAAAANGREKLVSPKEVIGGTVRRLYRGCVPRLLVELLVILKEGGSVLQARQYDAIGRRQEGLGKTKGKSDRENHREKERNCEDNEKKGSPNSSTKHYIYTKKKKKWQINKSKKMRGYADVCMELSFSGCSKVLTACRRPKCREMGKAPEAQRSSGRKEPRGVGSTLYAAGWKPN